MSILTDEECRDVYNKAMALPDRSAVSVTRHIEAAVIAKLAAGVSVEPLPVNESGSTMTVTRWHVETPSGWIGSWDKDAITNLVQTAIAAARAQALEEAARISEKHFHSTTAKQIRALIGKAST